MVSKDGQPGQPGKNELLREGETKELPSKCHIEVQEGDVLKIETPGGGGYGKAQR